MTAMHPDFVIVPTAATFGIGETAFDYGTVAIDNEADLNWETREMLEQICASVSNVAEEISLDFSDSLVDLDEVFDRLSL